eukprot:5799213-Alexandrium_andersonii.AAC.1
MLGRLTRAGAAPRVATLPGNSSGDLRDVGREHLARALPARLEHAAMALRDRRARVLEQRNPRTEAPRDRAPGELQQKEVAAAKNCRALRCH